MSENLTGLRYGNRRVTKMYGQVVELRRAIAAEGTPAIQDAWGKVEEHIDFAYANASDLAPHTLREIEEADADRRKP